MQNSVQYFMPLLARGRCRGEWLGRCSVMDTPCYFKSLFADGSKAVQQKGS
jgi:hypothetical protein